MTGRESLIWLCHALGSQHQADSVFGFSERRWHFYESRILSQLGDIEPAIEAQERALALYPIQVVGDRTLIELDRAGCVIRGKEIVTGLQIARDVLMDMPAEHRADIFLRCAWNVASAVPARFRCRPEVSEYCDLLRSLPAADA